MPNIDKIKKFYEDFILPLGGEREENLKAKIERTIEPPSQDENILPWSEEELKLDENQEGEDQKSDDVDQILEELERDEGDENSKSDDVFGQLKDIIDKNLDLEDLKLEEEDPKDLNERERDLDVEDVKREGESKSLDDLLRNAQNINPQDLGIHLDDIDNHSDLDLRDEVAANEDLHIEKMMQVDDFNIDYQTFIQNLNTYPRNLKIAIAQALIDSDIPKYKQEALVNLVEKNNRSVRYIAKFVSDLINLQFKLPVYFYKAQELSRLEKQFWFRFKVALLPLITWLIPVTLFLYFILYLSIDIIYLHIVSDFKYREGLSYIYENKRELAKETFKNAYYIKPKDHWFIKYAKAFESIHDYNSAREKYEELFTLSPFSQDATERGRTKFNREGYLRYAKMLMNLGEYNEANHVIEEVIVEYIYDYDALMLKGDNYLAWARDERNYYKDSINSYTILLNQYGLKKDIVFKLFNAYIEAGEEKEAYNVHNFLSQNDDFKINSEVYTKFAGLLIDKYKSLIDYNKKERKISDDLKYLEGQNNLLSREFPKIKNREGLSRFSYVELNEDISYVLKRILRETPNFAPALFEQGRYFYIIGDNDKAEEYLRSFLEYFKENHDFYYLKFEIASYDMLSDIYNKANESVKAKNILDIAVNEYNFYKEYDLIDNANELSSIYEKRGDFLSSIMDYENSNYFYKKAVNEGVPNQELYYKIALINYKRGSFKESIPYLFKIENEAGYSNNTELFYTMGAIFYHLKDYLISRSYYLKALSNVENKINRVSELDLERNLTHKNLLIKQAELLNNLGVLNITLSKNSPERDALFNRGIEYLTESIKAANYVSDNFTSDAFETNLASLNLRNVWNNVLKSEILIYENLAESLD